MLNLPQFLASLEETKLQIMLFLEESKHILVEDYYENEIITAPFKNNNPINVNGYPVYVFYYEGSLPTYKGYLKDKEYGAKIARYYNLATARQLNTSSPVSKQQQKKKFVLCIEHRTKDKYIADLDNRNKKFIIDALRLNRLYEDDNYKQVAIYEDGTNGHEANEVVVYLVEEEHFIQFLSDKKMTKTTPLENEIDYRKAQLKLYNEQDLKRILNGE